MTTSARARGEVAAICLTASLALFVATVYSYDALTMPEGFWNHLIGWIEGKLSRREEQRLERAWVRKRQEKRQENRSDPLAVADAAVFDELSELGPVFIGMVRTWQRVFTPAVLLGFAGFALLVLDTGSVALVRGCLGAVAVTAVLYFLMAKPHLGVD